MSKFRQFDERLNGTIYRNLRLSSVGSGFPRDSSAIFVQLSFGMTNAY